jgi:hypothetical protein
LPIYAIERLQVATGRTLTMGMAPTRRVEFGDFAREVQKTERRGYDALNPEFRKRVDRFYEDMVRASSGPASSVNSPPPPPPGPG